MDYTGLFNALYPGFFQEPGIHALPEEAVFVEMALDLREDVPVATPLASPKGIAFRPYRGDPTLLREAASRVDAEWVQYFTDDARAFCAFDGKRIAAFCILTNMGVCRGLRVAGPGCVGTLPEYRRRGIGLEMVRRAIEQLRREGADICWIHYTHLEGWYGRLGCRTVVRWSRDGIIK